MRGICFRQELIDRNSRGFPHIDSVRLGQGDNFKLANADGIVVCRNVDKRDVYSLSTVTAGNYVDVPKTRFNTVERKLKPEMLLDYSKYMGGVDRMDQTRSYYDIGRKAKKYWRYILFNIFNIAIINSFILYKKKHHASDSLRSYSLLDYKSSLIILMMDKYRKGILDEPILTSSNSIHKSISSRTRVCVNCRKSNKRNENNNVIIL